MNDIKFDYSNSLIDTEEMRRASEKLADYVAQMSSVSENKRSYIYDESSINLPFDTEIIKEAEIIAKRVSSKALKYIIVVGIGGSNLGAKAILDALGLHGPLSPFLPRTSPNIIFADTVSPKLLSEIKTILEKNIVSPDEVLINVISKSGDTTETISNFEVIYSVLSSRFENVKSRVVVTTDKNSKLWDVASELGFELLSIPKKVGGRYSVFSSVGIFPALIAGVDVASLHSGARAMHDRCVKYDIMENPALVFATLTYLHNKKGLSIDNTFVFNPHLESVGRWYRQLMAESIGKKYTNAGDEIYAGMTPIVSVGSTDLHSMAQLYLRGPKDKFTTFVYARHSKEDMTIPKNRILNGLVDNIEEKSLSKIMSSIFEGIVSVYKKDKIPFLEIFINDVDAYSIGQFLQFKMFEIMYLAKLLNVNAFDQPAVDDYKKEVRRILNHRT